MWAKVTGKPSMVLLIKLIGTRLFYLTANAGQTLAQVREYVNTHSKPKADLKDSELFFFDPLDPESPELLLPPPMDDKTLEQLGFHEWGIVAQKPLPGVM